MRCLYCNKKLSLLKLAKGDSFCSAEHFDAYQLQLSKNAYERLANQPEEVPKPALVLKTQEPPQAAAPQEAEPDAESAFARLSSFRGKTADPGLNPPPYAGFLASPLPAFPPRHAYPLSSEADANEPVGATREVSFPVHDVDATVCILNLYLRLGLSSTAPRNWAPAWNPIHAPQDFPGQIRRPAHDVSPVREPAEDAVDAPEIAEAAPAIEAVPELDAVSELDAVPELEAVPELDAVPELEAASVEPPTAIEEPAPVEPEPPVEPVVKVIIKVKPAAAVKAPEPEIEVNVERVPFLMAPSFAERNGGQATFDADASSAPNEWKMAPVLDLAPRIARKWSGEIPQSARFAGNNSLQARDAAAQLVPSGVQLPQSAAVHLPHENTMEFQGWQAKDGAIGIARPPLDVNRAATAAIGFTPPKPNLMRPHPDSAPRVDRSKILASSGTVDSVFVGVLQTRPHGDEPVFEARTASALNFAVPSVLAPFPEGDLFSATAWQDRPRHFSLPVSIADGTEAQRFPLEDQRYASECLKQDAASQPAPSLANLPGKKLAWSETDFALPRRTDPEPAASQPALSLAATQQMSGRHELKVWMVSRSVFDRAFIVAPSVVAGGADLTPVATTTLPNHGEIPVRDTRIGLCDLRIAWQSCAPAKKDVPLAKCLPSRKSPIMPVAREWPRLAALPQ